jgi:hypothetical protein
MNISTHESNVALYFNANGKTNDSEDRDKWSYIDENGKVYNVIFNGFEWTETNGWNKNKLVIANGSSIDIDFMPFAKKEILDGGVTFEFEFNTINVYDENAVICNICSDNGAPGIIITATEAKLIISKGLDGPETDVATSTKFKSGENNRVSFVITPRGDENSRSRFVKIYVNGIICGVVDYSFNSSFINYKTIHFEGTEDAEIELSSIKFYNEALTNDLILNNYIFYRNDSKERLELYNKNNIYDSSNLIDIDSINEQIPVMLFKQRRDKDGNPEGAIEDIEREYEDSKKTVYFDIEYINIQDPTFNFKVERARVRPQGTSSMKYPKKNFRFYTAKEDDTILYDYEGKIVSDRKYSFKKNAAPVSCWCLKADFAESSGTHNTGVARYWNSVLKEAKLLTKSQELANKFNYEYDVRTTIDGFPIVLFYQPLDSKPKFIGKYNFNNDKSTEDVFGFTGGVKIERELKYYPIGEETPIIHEGECTFDDSGTGYTTTPTHESPLYVLKGNSDEYGEKGWYMLRSNKLFDNPRMECWELLDSGSAIALFKTTKGFSVERDKKETVGRYYNTIDVNGNETEVWEEAFESRFPDCEKYYNTNNLKRFCEWLVSCRYLKIDDNGKSVNIEKEDSENAGEYNGIFGDKITICSLTKYKGNDIYYKWENGKYVKLNTKPNDSNTDNTKPIITVPNEKYEDENILYLVKEFNIYHNYPIELEDNAENRKEKFRIEKYDHIDMEKMAAYYIYLLRFGGVDQTVKNAMLTTEGSDDNLNSLLPSKWYFINYDNDTILGVKNNGHLVFDPYITRETKENNGTFVYAGRESTLWNNLENDEEFMSLVKIIDNSLSNSTNGLSYSNAIDMFNNKQSGQWCERVYNMDAQYKYIDSYISPTLSDTSGSADLDYLFDVQGSRSAHRKWWLSKRFNIIDSRFITGDFVTNAVTIKVNDLPSDRYVIIKSGEDIYYSIGGNNSVYYTTNTTITPGKYASLPIFKGTQIGTPLSVYGAPNIEELDLRDLSDSLVLLELAFLNSPNLGTKLKKLYIGDKDNPVKNNSSDWTISGFGNLEKCDEIDLTGMLSQTTIDDLKKLKNLKEFYAAGTNMNDMSFAVGGKINEIEAPIALETLKLEDASEITFDKINFYSIDEDENKKITKYKDDNFGSLKNLSIKNCSKMMTNHEWIFNWLKTKKNSGEDLVNYSLTLHGINWTFEQDSAGYVDYSDLNLLKEIKTKDIKGNIHIDDYLGISGSKTMQSIFGENCFNSNSEIRITASPEVRAVGDDTIIEGDGQHIYKFIKINVNDDGGNFKITISDNNGNIPNDRYVHYKIDTDKIIVSVDENDSDINKLTILLEYIDEHDNIKAIGSTDISIKKRVYPNNASIQGDINLDNLDNYDYTLAFTSINNDIVNGIMTYEWTVSGDAAEAELNDGSGRKVLVIESGETSEKCTLKLQSKYDGTAKLSVKVCRKFDQMVLFEKIETTLYISDPDTVFNEHKKPELYQIFKNANLTKNNKVTTGMLKDFDVDKLKDLFKGNTSITNFVEFEYCTKMTNIPSGMFSGCTNLTNIILPSTIIGSINSNAFAKCEKLTEINLKNANEILDSAFSGCKLLNNVKIGANLKTIGKNAFADCISIGLFSITESLSTIAYSNNDNPFMGCKNITFVKSSENDKYKVIDGCLYEKIDEKTYNLIHIGKNSNINSFPSDKTIYAISYSMEYKNAQGEDVIIPENVVFENCTYLFRGSLGNSITLKRKLGANVSYLFTETNFNGNYYFASNETVIPDYCFYNIINLNNEYNVPGGITYIGKQAFTNTNIKKIILPDTLTGVHEEAIYNAKNLEAIIFKDKNGTFDLPEFKDSNFTNNKLTDVCIPYKKYETVKKDIEKGTKNKKLYFYLRPSHVYETGGTVTILSNGTYLTNENGNVSVKVGGFEATYEEENKYWTYKPNGDYFNTSYGNINIEVTSGNTCTIVGIVLEQNTKIFIGDNSYLITGNGFDFTKGINNIKSTLSGKDLDKIVYNQKCKGIVRKDRNEIKTQLTFTGTTEESMSKLYYGVDLYTTIGEKGLQVNNSYISETFTFNKEMSLNGGKTISINFNSPANKHGINSFVINKIGNPVYSDPINENMVITDDIEQNYKVISIKLNAPVEVPKYVHVSVVEEKNIYEYRKFYNEPLNFIIPNKFNFTATSTDFTTFEGKEYKLRKSENVVDNIINLYYDAKSGIEHKGNVLCFYSEFSDWYINLEKMEGKWGSILNDEVNVSEIITSNANGLKNTLILSNNTNSIFDEASKFRFFENDIIGYIPSYIEIEMLRDHLHEINNYLKTIGKKEIDLNNLWTSESFDDENAYNSNGEIINKTETLNYYIFGRKINSLRDF